MRGFLFAPIIPPPVSEKPDPLAGGPAPARADQGALPAEPFERQSVAGQGVEAVVAGRDGIAAVAGPDIVRDVPEKFAGLRHGSRLSASGEEWP